MVKELTKAYELGYNYYRKGMVYFEKNDMKNALDWFLKSADTYGHFKVYYRIYQCCQSLEEKTKALKYLKMSYEANQNNDLTAFEYAKSLIEQSRYDDAERILLDILKRNPSYKKAKMEYEKLH